MKTQDLKTRYEKEAIPQMMRDFGYTNKLQVPRIVKVTLNIGTSKTTGNPKLMDVMVNTLTRITGQKPVLTKARQSISAFKVREGQVVGMKVTLRGKRMNDFITRCINIALPRVRDFQGISPHSFDPAGKSYTLAFKEQIVFPEIKSDEIDKLHGMEVTFSLASKGVKESFALMKMLGFPFRTEAQELEYIENVKRMKEAKRQRERARQRIAAQAKAAQAVAAVAPAPAVSSGPVK